MTTTDPTTAPEGDPAPPPDPNDPNNITVPVAPPPPAPPKTGDSPQPFTSEDVERIRQEERARVLAEQQRADQLENELAQLRKAEEDRQAAASKAERDAQRAAKKKEEEEMELRDLIERKDQEWEQRLAEERAEREKAFALLEQERYRGGLERYLASRMLEVGDDISPELRDLVSGNTEQEIDASITLLIQKSELMRNNALTAMRNINAGRPTVGVTAPPVGPMDDTVGGTRTYTADELKAMTPEEYAQVREPLLRAAAQSRRGQ